MIEVKNTIGTKVYTKEELRSELEDLAFLRDAFLVLLNEKACTDLPYSKTEAIRYAKEMYERLDYSQEFIDECFKSVS